MKKSFSSYEGVKAMYEEKDIYMALTPLYEGAFIYIYMALTPIYEGYIHGFDSYIYEGVKAMYE